MRDDEFEWDDEKAAHNAEKHGVTFEEARPVFRDPFAIELLDDREDYGEDRFILIGMSATGVLVVVYVDRQERNRIISARKAEPNERRFYHEQNQ
ncbi:MAG: BrnT family toxin [Rhizobiales bacterium]|nr:BrnT family toxin [Hyphomicrobiales bacterium]